MSTRTILPAAAVAILLTVGAAPAQIGPGPDNPAAPTVAADRNAETSYSWVGAFGLLGLLGLVGARNRTTSREHDFAGGRSSAPTRS